MSASREELEAQGLVQPGDDLSPEEAKLEADLKAKVEEAQERADAIERQKPTPTDHKAEALASLARAHELGEGSGGHDLAIPIFTAAAQVHASLAIAEGQERVAEEIKAFRELMAGSAT